MRAIPDAEKRRGKECGSRRKGEAKGEGKRAFPAAETRLPARTKNCPSVDVSMPRRCPPGIVLALVPWMTDKIVRSRAGYAMVLWEVMRTIEAKMMMMMMIGKA